MNDTRKCLICGEEIEIGKFAPHVKREHNLKSAKEYYDLYLRSEDEGICEYCGKEETQFKNISLGYKRFCSRKCCGYGTQEKRKQTNIKRYGTESTAQNGKVREKMKETNVKKYGVENPLQTDHVKEKSRKTSFEKYGTSHPFKSNIVKENYKKSMINKYGAENPNQVKEIKKKGEETNIKRYGNKNPLLNEEVARKTKKTNLEKIGYKNPFESSEVQNKCKETIKKKYGTEVPLRNEEIKNKKKQTNIEKYGVENPSENEKVIQKMKETNLDRYGVENVSYLESIQNDIHKKHKYLFLSKLPQRSRDLNVELIDKEYFHCKYYHTWRCTICGSSFVTLWVCLQTGGYKCPVCYPRNNISQPQIELFNICKSILPYPVFEYKDINNKFIDIAIPKLGVAIEYDGSYWHKDHYEDMKRQKLLEDEGWVFLRYRDYLPSNEELLSDVDFSLITGKSIIKS